MEPLAVLRDAHQSRNLLTGTRYLVVVLLKRTHFSLCKILGSLSVSSDAR